uniref:Uncharacterized protein n=1 Tax=Dunaliella tertiolecta TaxID=3047 RepID=A0A7S3VIX2_DUNTE|mmetsp:Transcript_14741/g.39096  ORF Transcript_14741/g.39096 Transcript_14741/m.39096 type:complete len:149 (+) Transcript_14741:503-949(+)
MGRLRGLSALGMPVAVLLAYLWNSVYTDKASVLCSVPSGPSDPPELTDAEVKKGQDRAREFKKGLKTAEEQALFPSRKLDGKGHPLLFVASWQALQLVLSKAKNLCGMGKLLGRSRVLGLAVSVFPASKGVVAQQASRPAYNPSMQRT